MVLLRLLSILKLAFPSPTYSTRRSHNMIGSETSIFRIFVLCLYLLYINRMDVVTLSLFILYRFLRETIDHDADITVYVLQQSFVQVSSILAVAAPTSDSTKLLHQNAVLHIPSLVHPTHSTHNPRPPPSRPSLQSTRTRLRPLLVSFPTPTKGRNKPFSRVRPSLPSPYIPPPFSPSYLTHPSQPGNKSQVILLRPLRPRKARHAHPLPAPRNRTLGRRLLRIRPLHPYPRGGSILYNETTTWEIHITIAAPATPYIASPPSNPIPLPFLPCQPLLPRLPY